MHLVEHGGVEEDAPAVVIPLLVPLTDGGHGVDAEPGGANPPVQVTRGLGSKPQTVKTPFPAGHALLAFSGSSAVLAIDKDGRVHRQPVKVGLQNDQLAEILTGIDDGQLVATSSLNELAEGDIVTPQVQTTTAYAR